MFDYHKKWVKEVTDIIKILKKDEKYNSESKFKGYKRKVYPSLWGIYQKTKLKNINFTTVITEKASFNSIHVEKWPKRNIYYTTISVYTKFSFIF